MPTISELISNNRTWAAAMKEQDANFFANLAKQQSPEFLWIGCSDSRVPANQIIGLKPGEVFVHRNVANLVVHSDLNCLSVLEFAVKVLKVRHIILCGHYGCGGVCAATEDTPHGIVDNWLRNIRTVAERHAKLLSAIDDPQEHLDLLCELNVREQARNICLSTIVQDAWRDGQKVSVHGWIYSIQDGLIKDLQLTASSHEQAEEIHKSLPQRARDLKLVV